MIHKSIMSGLVTVLVIIFLPLCSQAQSTFKLACLAEQEGPVDRDSYMFDVNITSSTVTSSDGKGSPTGPVSITDQWITWLAIGSVRG